MGTEGNNLRLKNKIQAFVDHVQLENINRGHGAHKDSFDIQTLRKPVAFKNELYIIITV